MVNHPSLVKGMGREKQGFTLCNLIDRTHSPLGRRLLKQFPFSIPLTQMDAVSLLRHDGDYRSA